MQGQPVLPFPLGNSTPSAPGAGSAGTDGASSRQDHSHPENKGIGTLSGAGALTLVRSLWKLTTTAIGQAVSLPDGTYQGQTIRVTGVAGYAGGQTTVFAPTTRIANFTSATLAALFDWVDVTWDGAAWYPSGYGGGTVIA